MFNQQMRRSIFHFIRKHTVDSISGSSSAGQTFIQRERFTEMRNSPVRICWRAGRNILEKGLVNLGNFYFGARDRYGPRGGVYRRKDDSCSWK